MYCTKSSVDKVEARGVKEGKCAVCAEQTMIVSVGRSIWFDGFMGGGGEVRTVGVVYCPKCDGKPELPAAGTPIYESEIVRVATD